MALNYVSITGTFDDGSGAALTGTATFTPSETVYASGIPVVSASNPVQAQIVNGALKNLSGGTLTLLATDNAGLTYEGLTGFFYWSVSVTLGTLTQPGWSFFLLNSNGSSQELYSLANTVAGGGLPLTTLGDTVYEDATPKAVRLPGNTSSTKKFLTQTGTGSVSAAPAWGVIAPADLSQAFPHVFYVDNPAYGVHGNGKMVADVATTSGSKVITSATAAFTSGDIGKTVMINGGNGTAAAPYIDVIASVQSATQATLTTANAGATATACSMVWGNDDTAAIQSVINAASTYAQANNFFAQVAFGPKIYMLTAAPTQATSPQTNAQLLLPWPAVNGQSRKLVIALTGVGNAGNTQYWESVIPNLQGTCLVSTQTAPSSVSGTYGEQSVLGGPSAGGAFTGSFANVKLFIDGITVWHPIYTNMYVYDFGYIAGMEWGTFSSQAFAPAANLSSAAAAQPYQSAVPSANNIGVGCRFPLVGNNDDVAGGSFAAQGIDLPLIVADHFTADRVATVYCDAAIRIDLVNGISSLAHAVTIGQWSCEQYQGGLTCNGGGSGYCQVNITMDAESIGGADPVYDVSDNGNLYGVIRIGDPGRTHRYPTIANGAAHLKVVNDMMGPGYWSGAPSVPATTVNAQNTAWRDATVVITSGGAAVSAITVDGQATGLTLGNSGAVTVRVPAGKNINATYAGAAPTWKWWLD